MDDSHTSLQTASKFPMFRKRPTNPGVSEGGGRSKKQRVVDCLKIVLDIAYESADWFPPLKAVLGGVSVLIKHYEQFEEVKEKVQKLASQLNRLKKCIVMSVIDGDTEEAIRRERLASAFKEIEESSQILLAKKLTTRFADKGEDLNAVTTLIERLQEAIGCYQLSQQQAIYNQITHLTSSFDTLLKLRENHPVVRNKLEPVLARLEKLKEGSLKDLQRERGARLFDDLVAISEKGKRLYERIVSEGYVENEGDIVAVS